MPYLSVSVEFSNVVSYLSVSVEISNVVPYLSVSVEISNVVPYLSVSVERHMMLVLFYSHNTYKDEYSYLYHSS